MATVFLAEGLKHKRKVAVKVLKPELAAVLGAERFVPEISRPRRSATASPHPVIPCHSRRLGIPAGNPQGAPGGVTTVVVLNWLQDLKRKVSR